MALPPPLTRVWRRFVPAAVRRGLRRRLRPPGGPRFGNLRRLAPVSRRFGFDRGQPIDRHYIEGFLAEHAEDVRGRVLEVGDDGYTRRFGGDRVDRSDVLNVHPTPTATFVDDLATGLTLPAAAFDCVILTQTLHLIYDVRAAAGTVHRILKPGGVLLVTVPGISQIDAGAWRDTWFWSFTPAALERVLVETFGSGRARVRGHGNVLAACAFLHGLASAELSRRELAHVDPLYPLLVVGRARKAEGVGGP